MKNEIQKEHMVLYALIPQWIEGKDPDSIIGVKDLYLVHTCGSDFFIKKGKEAFDVYTAQMKPELQNVTREEALLHIRQTCEANLIFCYQVTFRNTDGTEKCIRFDTNAPKSVFKEVSELLTEKKDSLLFEEDVVRVFQILVKEVFGYLIQEQSGKENKVLFDFGVGL